MSEDQFQDDPAGASQLPGSFLRAARESQGLSVAEVAGVTKFSPRQIEALENDDFSQLQGLAFQRGFVRAYARMLKQDAEPLLAMLDSNSQPELVVPPDNMGETNPKPFYRKHFKVLALLAVVGLGALATASLMMSPSFKNFGSTLHTAGSAAQSSTAAVSTVSVQPEHLPVTATEAVVMTESLSATTAPVPELAGLESLSPAQAAAPLSPPAVAVPDLRFEFRDLSWLEVKDGNDQIVLTGEFSGGVVKSVSKGKPPFQIWVGKASAVKVIYQGQPVDTQPHTREDVARLTLGR